MRALLLTLIILYFLFKIFRRNVTVNTYNYSNFGTDTRKQEKEGKIKVENIKTSKKDSSTKGGDFIDYEEIK